MASITPPPHCEHEPRADDWQHLRPRVVKLLNSVTSENMKATADQFKELGFPWRDADSMDALAKTFVSASAGHGFYAECYGELACALNDREVSLSAVESDTVPQDHELSIMESLCQQESQQDSRKVRQRRFLTTVKVTLSSQFSDNLSDMSALAQGNTTDAMDEFHRTGRAMPAAEGKKRDRVVNICKFVASLFHLQAYSVEDLRGFLQCLGVLNTVAAVANATPEQREMPTVSMLSGNFPSAQPACGETMADWRERLAQELKFPPDRLGLLAGDAEVPADACLGDFEGSLQVLVRHVHIKEEYRIEAGCTLLSKAMPDLIKTTDGRDLLNIVVDQWQGLGQEIPKRAQFMIMDLKSQIAGHGTVA